jgi:hypothetical protein
MPLTPELLRKYKNDYFVETGTYLGDGVRAALAAGFSQIASIEIAAELFRINREAFRENKNVRLSLGNSEAILLKVIRRIKKPITFWLDAHYSGGITGKGMSNSSVMKELEIIGRHPIKTHTILIDDIRHFGKNYLFHDDLKALTEEERKVFLFEDIEVEDLQKALMKINPDYQFRFEDGNTRADILAAFVPKKRWYHLRKKAVT